MDAIAPLIEMLTFEPAGDDVFVAPTGPAGGMRRLFGGQVAAQSLRAATLTVDVGRPPHSFHAYFIRPGRPGVPIELTVDRTRDGRSFSTRRVQATQEGEAILTLAASFHADEPGDDWQLPGPSAPSPSEAPPLPTGGPRPPAFRFMTPFELRPARELPPDAFPVIHPFWIRVAATMPDDPLLHACALAFMSDMGVVGSAWAPGRPMADRFTGASLDHAVWFHRPFRADRWLLFSVDATTNHGARGLARGTFHDEDGVLVASMAQEALLRPAGTPPVP